MVVNSGGGDVRKVLGPDLDHIRLIQTETPLFVGAARNIGIETSRAPFVAFLAADCIALPGWVDGRVARHLAGARMVSSAVATARPGTVIGTLAEWLVFPLRGPTLGEDEAIHYGRSFCRTMFAKAGFFAPELRVGEDSEFHRRADMIVEPVWAPEISVKHDDPASILALLLDLRQRGLRAASHLRPGRVPQTGPDWVTRQMKVRNQKIRQSLRGRQGLGRVRRVQLGLALALGLKSFETGLRQADKSLAKAEFAARAARDGVAADIDRAIGQAQIAVTLVPQNPAYRAALGELLLKRGRSADLGTAIGHLQTALAIAPTSARALWLAATALHKDGQSAAGLILCEQAARSAPAASAVVLVAARAAIWAKRPHLALCLAQKALAADPASVPAHQFLEALHRMAGRSALAEKRKAMVTCLQDAKATRTNNS